MKYVNNVISRKNFINFKNSSLKNEFAYSLCHYKLAKVTIATSATMVIKVDRQLNNKINIFLLI